MPSAQVRPRAKSIGHYVLGKTVGEGTFGKVKLGTHILTGERVAVKVLEKERIVDVADVERVAREVHILKLIRHPHVVQLYEIIETRRQLYLLMEYASGGELFDYIVANGRVQEPEACRFFHQILAGVEKIHAMNIVHRDLKPENLLLDDHKNIKIVDFGLSNVYRDGQKLKTACGSPCYAAPEMIAGHSYVPSLCDLWSCGVILFALVCGYLPFEDQNTATLYKKILAADYHPPRFISDSVKDLIAGLLTTDPTKRFTIPVVRAHDWYRQIPESSKPHEAPEQNGLEEDVLRELDAFGFPRDYAVRCLEVNKHNHVTTTYYLLAEKKRRMMERLDRLLPGADVHRNFNMDLIGRPEGTDMQQLVEDDCACQSPEIFGANDNVPQSQYDEATVFTGTGKPGTPPQVSRAPQADTRYPTSSSALPQGAQRRQSQPTSPCQTPATEGTRRSPMSSSVLGSGSPSNRVPEELACPNPTATVGSVTGTGTGASHTPRGSSGAVSYRPQSTPRTIAQRIFGKDSPRQASATSGGGTTPRKRTVPGSGSAAVGSIGSSSITARYNVRGTTPSPRENLKPTESARRREDLAAAQTAKSRLSARSPGAAARASPVGTAPASARERNSGRTVPVTAPLTARIGTHTPNTTPRGCHGSQVGSGLTSPVPRVWNAWTPSATRATRLSPR